MVQPILCSPTAPSVHRRQGGLLALKTGAGTAKMCCCHLPSWATESLGQVFKCSSYTKVHVPELGYLGIALCLAPGSLGCLLQLLTPYFAVLITIVSVHVGPDSECCSFFSPLLFSPCQCNIPSGFSREPWNVSCSCQSPPEQGWALTGSSQ